MKLVWTRFQNARGRHPVSGRAKRSATEMFQRRSPVVRSIAVRVDGNAPHGTGGGDFDINLWADCAGAVSMVAIARRPEGAYRGRGDAAAVAKAETFANSLGARSSFWKSLRRATVC